MDIEKYEVIKIEEIIAVRFRQADGAIHEIALGMLSEYANSMENPDSKKHIEALAAAIKYFSLPHTYPGVEFSVPVL